MKLSDFNLFDVPAAQDDVAALAERTNDTQTLYPRDRTIAALFAEQAAAAPAAVALCQGDATLTYGALDRRANWLARELETQIGPLDGRLVAVALPRGFGLIAAMLAILKAGAGYLPIDPDFPAQRRAEMLRAANAAGIVIAHDADPAVDGAPDLVASCPVVRLDPAAADVDGHPADPPPASGEELPARGGTPDGLAYVMFTSGSTGAPKAVMVPQRAVVRLVRGNTFAQMDAGQVFLLNAPISFDASTLEIWAPLLNGGRLALMPPGPSGLSELGRAIADHGVTTLWLTAGLFNLAIDQIPDSLRPLRQLLIGGEALSVSHVRRALDALPGCQLINGYGPTENTTFSCCFPITRAACADAIPIGKPIANSTAYVLDDALNPLPPGIAGELYVGGDGLALGYLNDTALTAQKFVDVPWAAGGRLYRTGDLASWRADGTIDFLGRIDNQIKLRGYRIEPGEVEAALLAHPDVTQATVGPHGRGDGERTLVAHFAGSAQVDLAGLRRHLDARLPAFMVPGHLIQLDALPLTANGKVDRKALPAPVAVTPRAEAAGTPPEGETERQLLELWQDVLGRPVPGVTDDFFDLGGHSLAAAKLIARIEAAFGVALPFTTAFTAPTVRQLASAVIDRAAFGHDAIDQPMVRLSATSDGPALFALPPGTSDALSYARLAERLAPYDVYAFNLIESEDRLARYADLILQTQPHRPSVLFGYSGGGNLAFHVAHRLEARGHRVSAVVMLDSSRFLRPVPFPPEEAARLATEFLSSAQVRDVAHNSLLRDKAFRRIQRYYEMLSTLVDDTPIEADIHLIASPTAASSYSDASGNLLVSQTAWAEVTRGRFHRHVGHGDHGEMLIDPHFAANAAAIRGILETATETRSLDPGKAAS